MGRRRLRRLNGAGRSRRSRRWLWGILGAAVLGLALALGGRLAIAANAPVGAQLVLGGSIQREIRATAWAMREPSVPILISHGSPAPCIRALFERAAVAGDRVWLEECARSTFGNFAQVLPLLRRWQVRRVRLITSESHLPRALWLGRTMLGAAGIWVDLDAVAETGVPGNREAIWKTALDLGRGALWGLVSWAIAPDCDRVYPLSSVDLDDACREGFRCEHQAQLQNYCEIR